MPSIRFTLVLLLCLAILCSASHAQKKESNFPTDEEIKLVLTQADRAVQEYKPLLDMEEKMFGSKGASAVAKDREVVNGIEIAIKAFRRNPQAFNGPLGFSFFEWLDDADRNALLCASGAATEANTHLIGGDIEKAQTEVSLANSCTEVSTLFYTVSENAGALYTRFVQDETNLAEYSAQVAQKCVGLLKQNGAAKNSP